MISDVITTARGQDGLSLHIDKDFKGERYWGIAHHDKCLFVGNQQNWDTLRAERSGVSWRSGKLLEGSIVASWSFNGLSLHLLPAV